MPRSKIYDRNVNCNLGRRVKMERSGARSKKREKLEIRVPRGPYPVKVPGQGLFFTYQ